MAMSGALASMGEFSQNTGGARSSSPGLPNARGLSSPCSDSRSPSSDSDPLSQTAACADFASRHASRLSSDKTVIHVLACCDLIDCTCRKASRLSLDKEAINALACCDLSDCTLSKASRLSCDEDDIRSLNDCVCRMVSMESFVGDEESDLPCFSQVPSAGLFPANASLLGTTPVLFLKSSSPSSFEVASGCTLVRFFPLRNHENMPCLGKQCGRQVHQRGCGSS
mmetsp:Transcript_55041/g.108706  ORF Transcript_55041/g.108706 Transcript_55041/m.108706 type:complete len:225 (-) Transcript_55041:6-680(-)